MILMPILKVYLYIYAIQPCLNPTHGIREFSMDGPFILNSMKSLVHRDFYQLPKPHMRTYALS
jgi:hypothetical protein